RLLPSLACTVRNSGHVAMTTIAAQTIAGRNGCRIHRLPPINTARNTMANTVRVRSLPISAMAKLPALTTPLTLHLSYSVALCRTLCATLPWAYNFALAGHRGRAQGRDDRRERRPGLHRRPGACGLCDRHHPGTVGKPSRCHRRSRGLCRECLDRAGRASV